MTSTSVGGRDRDPRRWVGDGIVPCLTSQSPRCCDGGPSAAVDVSVAPALRRRVASIRARGGALRVFSRPRHSGDGVKVDDTSITVSWDGDGRLADLDRDEPWLPIVTRGPLIGRPIDEYDTHAHLITAANDLFLVRAFSRQFRATVTNEQRTVTVASDQHEWDSRTTATGGPRHVSVTFRPDPQQVGEVASSLWLEHECQRLEAVAPGAAPRPRMTHLGTALGDRGRFRWWRRS